MDGRIKKIADHYGDEAQKIKTIEEMAELTKALCKHTIADATNANIDTYHKLVGQVIEEIADVQIMLDQMRYIFCVSDEESREPREAKLERTLERMQKE